jgi:ABC-type glycerol-3-phosphate transport system substrate-binding protein
MKPVAYFLCALALILICISPWLILSYYEKLPESPYFQGILSLWHISGWRTGGSSGAAFLQKRITQFEGQNPHVFIEMQSLTAEEALTALQSGEKPDIISYPYNTDIPLEMSALPAVDTIFSNLPDTAYPYMCGGYCVLVNTDKLIENSIDLESDWGIRPEALLDAAQIGVCFDAEDGCTSLPALALHAYPEAEKPQVSTWGEPDPPDAALSLEATWENGFEAFCSGDAGILIASHRQLFEATEQYTQGEVPPFAAYAIGPYTDMVQMVGVPQQSEDELRLQAAQSFAAFILSDSAQNKLEALGVFPVKPGLDIYQENDILFAMYEQLCPGAALPRPGTKETLDELAKSAFSGDEHALKALRHALGG